MTTILTAQAPTTSEISPPAFWQLGEPTSTSTENHLPKTGLSHSTSPVETATESPQPAPLAIITASPLTMAILAFVILSNILLLLIILWLWKHRKQYLRNPIKSKSGHPTQETSLLETIRNQMERQQNLLQFVKQNQQTLLRRTEDMEQSIKSIERFQTVSTAPAPPPRAMDNPQPTTRLSPAKHLVHVLKQGGDRAALAKWSAVKVRITATSKNRIHRGDIAGLELEPAQAGASFLVFQVNGENLLVPNRETLGVFQRYQTGHTGLFALKRQLSRPTPQVSEPARVRPQGKLWQVVEQGEVLIGD